MEKVNTAIRLNQVILENSRRSQLVLLNLPRPPKNKKEVVDDYMNYMGILTENIPRVLFVGGSGKEVIAISS